MEQFIPEKDAARSLPALLDEMVAQGSRMVIERQGHPIAVLVGAEDYGEFIQREQAASAQSAEAHGTLLGEDVSSWLSVERMELRLGLGLLPLTDEEAGEELLVRLRAVRQGLAMRLGIIVPSVRVRDDLHIPSNTYCITIREREVFRWPIYMRQILATGPKFPPEALAGIAVQDPFSGRRAYWVPEADREAVQTPSCLINTPIDVITRQFYQVALSRAHEILSREDVYNLLRHLELREPALVAEVIPNVLGVWELHQILKQLLREQVSIRDLSFILETISDHAALISDLEEMVVVLRHVLGETICSPYLDGNRVIYALTIHPSLEQRLQRVLPDERSTPIEVSTPVEASLLETLETQMIRAHTANHEPVLLCSAEIRPFLRRFLASRFPTLPIIARSEVPDSITIQPIEAMALP